MRRNPTRGSQPLTRAQLAFVATWVDQHFDRLLLYISRDIHIFY